MPGWTGVNTKWSTIPTMDTLKRYKGDPIYKDENGKFWFSDELWVDVCGPFDSIEDAEVALRRYMDS